MVLTDSAPLGIMSWYHEMVLGCVHAMLRKAARSWRARSLYDTRS
jgi:hypothetical protein